MKKLIIGLILAMLLVPVSCAKAPPAPAPAPSPPEIEIVIPPAPATPSLTEQQTYTLNMRISPPGAGFISCPGNVYEPDTQVMLTAIPSSDYTFDYWEGNVSGSSTTATIVMDSDKSIIAHFKALPPPLFRKVTTFDILESTATIQWYTTENATFFVEYGTTNAYGSITQDTVWKKATDWGRVTLRELKPQTLYHFKICAIDDKDGRQAFSDDYTFTTLSPKGLFSARLYRSPFGGDLIVMRLNTNLFNGSSQTITVTKIEFLYEDGSVAFTLPAWAGTGSKNFFPTQGRSDLPESWANWPLAAGKSLFTGIEFDWALPNERELMGWQVKWYCLDAKEVEFTVTAEYSSMP